jgi:long-chain acyl-CoA synthetase
MRWAFGLRVYGIENLPARGAYVISPNHQSLLDSLVVAASLPKRVLKRTYWGAWVGIMFNGLFMRLVSRSTRVMPVDPDRRPLSSLAFGAAALEQGHPLVWFPEGGLTRDGTLKRFEPGVGLLLLAQPAPVVPVWIAGTYQVLPKGSRWPRRGPVSVTFGKPIDPDELLRRGSGQRPHERITRALHDVVAELGQSVAACLPKEESPPETGL